ncbi:hypothetical protein PIROE2DRAFT_13607, partial [Piromyces sp. E2]
MKSNKDEILLPPGVKSINELNIKKIEYDNSIKSSGNKKDTIINNINNISKKKGQSNENGLNKNSEHNNSNQIGLSKLSEINNSQNTQDDFFEDIDNSNVEKPKNFKPYVRKRNKRDVLKIISKKITPNEQLLKNPIISTLPVNDNKEINENDVSNNSQNNNDIKLIPQNQMKYLNADGTMMTTAEENIRNVIKNTHNSNKNNTTYLYNHK